MRLNYTTIAAFLVLCFASTSASGGGIHRKVTTALERCQKGPAGCADAVERALKKAEGRQIFDLLVMAMGAEHQLEHFSRARTYAERLIELDPERSQQNGIVLLHAKLLEAEGRGADAAVAFEDIFNNENSSIEHRIEAATYLVDHARLSAHHADALGYFQDLIGLRGSFSSEDRALLDSLLVAIDDDSVLALASATEVPFIAGALHFEHVRRNPTDNELRLDFRRNFPLHPLIMELEELVDESIQLPPTLGILLPLTGRFAVLGERIKVAMELAIDDQAHFSEEPFDVIFEDTQGTEEGMLDAIERLDTEHQVRAIVGPVLSDVAEAAARETEARGIPMISLSQRVGIPGMGPYIFRTQLTAFDQVQSVLRYAIEHKEVERFAILYPATDAGATFAELFWDLAIANNVQVVSVESYLPDTTDFRAVVQRLGGIHYLEKGIAEEDLGLPFLDERTRPQFYSEGEGVDARIKAHELIPGEDIQAVFLPDSANKAVMAASAMAFEEWNVGGVLPRNQLVQLLGLASWNRDDFARLGGRYVRSSYYVDAIAPDDWREPWASFAQRYEERGGVRPGVFEAIGYDTMHLAFTGLDIATPNRSAVQKALREILLEGALSGLTGFDETGEAVRTLRVFGFRDGEPTQLMPDIEGDHQEEEPSAP